MGLSVSQHRDDSAVTVAVRGEIDLSTVDVLAQEIAATTAAGTTTIIVDLTEVTFIDSVGIAALLKGRRLADGHGRQYRVTGAEGLVRKVLDLTGVWAHLSGPGDEHPG